MGVSVIVKHHKYHKLYYPKLFIANYLLVTSYGYAHQGGLFTPDRSTFKIRVVFTLRNPGKPVFES